MDCASSFDKIGLLCFREILIVIIRMALIEGEFASLVLFDAWILFVLVSREVCLLLYDIEKLNVFF